MMKEEEIYNKMIIIIKKFYIIDYAINYLTDLETAQRFINEPYVQPILEELYDCYEHEEATADEMIKPYIDELIQRIETADDDYMRITTEDYDFLKYVHQLLSKYDLDFAYFLSNLYLTVGQHEAIKEHYRIFNE